MQPHAATALSCTDCGACCHGDGPRYLRVMGADYSRLGDDAERVTQFIGNRCHMLLVGRRCIALSENVKGRLWSCSLYSDRPEICRSLERGSDECNAVLERERLHALE